MADGPAHHTPHWDDDGVRHVLVAAARQQWNIRIAERYPHGRGVMKYLARYVRGGPIKDHRFVAFDGQQVTFRYGTHRNLDGAGKPQQAELTLRVDEFCGAGASTCRCRACIACGRGACMPVHNGPS